ncbi:Protein arginine N-methyltransferase 2 [Diplonema papillatum]|nr:Protein arginine N-methyltransferase 2 [Diplonema papillatum]
MAATQEAGYHGLKKGENPNQWSNKQADIDDDHVYIDNHPVMEGWELPYQKEIAAVATRKGGKVLEVGFGMALSATAIQTHDIEEHVIIEANEAVFKKLQEWAAKQPHKVTPMFGLWQDVVSTLKNNDFDGIYYDTYPNNEESQHIHQFDFIKQVRRALKPGGILTYCNLTSLGVLRPRYDSEGSDEAAWAKLFEETQKPHLLACGFSEDEIKEYSIFGPLAPPRSCAYYQHNSLLIPVIEKKLASCP